MGLKQELLARASRSIQFLTTDIWRIRANKLPARQSFWITQLRISLLAIRGFNEDKCQLHASALTFYTVLSVVPVVAMAFGVAKGFGLEKLLEKQILTKLEGQEEVAERIIGFSQSLLQSTRGGAIAGVGIVVLFWAVIKVLGNIESSFNDIWGVKKARTLGRKVTDYLSIMVICPVLLVTAGSITILLSTQIALMVEKLSLLGRLADLILVLLELLPYAVIGVVFTFIYRFMPNTKVKLKSALWAGILAGTMYQVVQFGYISLQIGVARYGAVYGSFAALPLFLVWLQLSWLIVLFGAEMSFAHQNVDTYEFEADCLKASRSFKKIAALLIVSLCVKRFMRLEEPLTADGISRELETPIRLVRSLLFELTEAGLLAEVYLNGTEEIAYHPACHIDKLTIAGVMQRLDRHGIDVIPIAESPDLAKLREAVGRFYEIREQSDANLQLKDL